MSTAAVSQRATLADLMEVEGKAELIGGRIVQFMASGKKPGMVAFAIASRLQAHARQTGIGVGVPDGIGFAVGLLSSGRESFAPDAAYHVGPDPIDSMDFYPSAPIFAVEVRSKRDAGPAAEAELADKRADYFEAGTRAVWDVDPVAEVVHLYRSDDPGRPITFRRGSIADAEPAVPGWQMAVDDVFTIP